MKVVTRRSNRQGVSHLLILGIAALGLVGYTVYKQFSEDSAYSNTDPYNAYAAPASNTDPYYYSPQSPDASMDGAQMGEFRKRFDTDGDGEISDAEREAARGAMKARMLEKFDADGDGQLSEEERAQARASRPNRGSGREGKGRNPEMRAEMLERFDADGDGEISAEERANAREARMGRGQGRKGMSGKMRDPERQAKMLERFDDDGDGQLSQEEREGARAVMQEIRGNEDVKVLAAAVRDAHRNLMAAMETGEQEAIAAAQQVLDEAKAAMKAKRGELLGQ